MSLNGHGRHHCSTPHIKPPKPKDFVSGFALLEACQANNEGKAKELVRKMCCLSSAEVGPLVNFQDQTGRVSLSMYLLFTRNHHTPAKAHPLIQNWAGFQLSGYIKP